MQSHAETIDDIDYSTFCACFANNNFFYCLDGCPSFVRSQHFDLFNMVRGHMAYFCSYRFAGFKVF